LVAKWFQFETSVRDRSNNLMTTVTVKNIPEELYMALRQAAEANHRSINSEIIACIEAAVVSRPIDPEDFLARTRRLRVWTADHPLDLETLLQAKAAGRP
jgi:plasmid stability protein